MPQEWDEKGNPIKAPMEWDEKGNPISSTGPSPEQQSIALLPKTGQNLPGGIVGDPKAAAATMQPSFLGGARGTSEQQANVNALIPQVPGIVSGNRNAALTGASLAPAGAAIGVGGAAAIPGIARSTLAGLAGASAGEYVGNKIGPITGHVLGAIGGLSGGIAGAKGIKVPMGRLGFLESIFGGTEDAALAKKTVDVTDPAVSQDLISRMKKLVIPGQEPTAADLKRAGDLTQAPPEMIEALRKFGDRLAQNEYNRRLLMSKIPGLR